MQKFTVFTIIFAVIVLSVTAELVTHNYLAELYPQGGAASILGSIEEDNADLVSDFDTETEQPADPVTEEPEPQLEVEVNDPEPDLSSSDLKISEKVIGLLPSIDITGLKYLPLNYPGKVFDVMDTDVNPDEVIFAQLVVPKPDIKDEVVGTFYEFESETQKDARRIYFSLKTQAEAFTDIEVNETNQFGQNSFYINHKAKVNEVFVVVLADTKVYAFAYNKKYHETFKPFFGLLL